VAASRRVEEEDLSHSPCPTGGVRRACRRRRPRLTTAPPPPTGERTLGDEPCTLEQNAGLPNRSPARDPGRPRPEPGRGRRPRPRRRGARGLGSGGYSLQAILTTSSDCVSGSIRTLRRSAGNLARPAREVDRETSSQGPASSDFQDLALLVEGRGLGLRAAGVGVVRTERLEGPLRHRSAGARVYQAHPERARPEHPEHHRLGRPWGDVVLERAERRPLLGKRRDDPHLRRGDAARTNGPCVGAGLSFRFPGGSPST
jgi:hypothetical protein